MQKKIIITEAAFKKVATNLILEEIGKAESFDRYNQIRQLIDKYKVTGRRTLFSDDWKNRENELHTNKFFIKEIAERQERDSMEDYLQKQRNYIKGLAVYCKFLLEKINTRGANISYALLDNKFKLISLNNCMIKVDHGDFFGLIEALLQNKLLLNRVFANNPSNNDYSESKYISDTILKIMSTVTKIRLEQKIPWNLLYPTEIRKITLDAMKNSTQVESDDDLMQQAGENVYPQDNGKEDLSDLDNIDLKDFEI